MSDNQIQLEFIEEPFYTKLRVGTDCSGIEAPIQALRQLGIPFKHVFSSEIDKYCIQSIKANYEPEILFGDPDGPFLEGDITKRSISDVPDIDLYVCGFSCQPFSQAGRRKGFLDKRGNVFWGCLEVIQTKQPKYFILGNVQGLLYHNKGETWQVIWDELINLEQYGYKIYWKLLNTKDCGIPQNRPRVYIVGTKEKFIWPEHTQMDDIKNYVDWQDKKEYKTKRKFTHNTGIFIDLNFAQLNKFPCADKYSSCLNTNTGLWCIPLKRYANISEKLLLQGFPTNFKQVVSNTQLHKQIGNSMSVNVLVTLISNLILTQLRPLDPRRDPEA